MCLVGGRSYSSAPSTHTRNKMEVIGGIGSCSVASYLALIRLARDSAIDEMPRTVSCGCQVLGVSGMESEEDSEEEAGSICSNR